MSEETIGSILVTYLLNTLTRLPESHTWRLGILPGSALCLPAADPVLVFDLHSRLCCVVSCDFYQGLLHYMNPLSHTASWTSASSSKIKTDLLILDPLKAMVSPIWNCSYGQTHLSLFRVFHPQLLGGSQALLCWLPVCCPHPHSSGNASAMAPLGHMAMLPVVFLSWVWNVSLKPTAALI